MSLADVRPGLRFGLLDDRTDRLLLALTIALPLLDFSQTSWWATGVKPFGDGQRWLTVVIQATYLTANASRLDRFCLRHAAFLALVGFTAASVLWSSDPGTSLNGAIRLFLLGASIFVGQDRHGPGIPITIFRNTCCAIVLMNLLAIAVPSVSIMGGTLAGAFRGLTDHKNTLGQLCALALAFVLARLAVASSPRETRALAIMALLIVLTIVPHPLRDGGGAGRPGACRLRDRPDHPSNRTADPDRPDRRRYSPSWRLCSRRPAQSILSVPSVGTPL